MINSKVIVSGPAIGKTYLAKINKRFIDLDGEKAIYKYGLEGKSDYELESTKLNRGKVVNNDSKEYIFKRLNEELKTVEKEIARASGKLSNNGFLEKAPKALVDNERQKLNKYIDMREKLKSQIKDLQD